MNQKRKELKKELLIIGEDKKTTPTHQSEQKPVHVPISFDTWWLQTQNKYKFRAELKEAIRRHFTARGFINDSQKFEQGLKDFGYNIPNL